MMSSQVVSPLPEQIPDEEFGRFVKSLTLRARVVKPGDPSYDLERECFAWNYRGKPCFIIICASTRDVALTVQFLQKYHLDFTVAGGRHSRHAMKDGVVCLSLAGMRAVTFDMEKRQVEAQGGARIADVDRECEIFGYYTPLGVDQDTGIGGFINGCGQGYLSQKYGLAVDNLVAAEIVLADGSVKQVSISSSNRDDQDLFWAIRGAGFNFGIVTKFTLKAYSVGHDPKKHGEIAPKGAVYGGPVLYPFALAKQILKLYRECTRDDTLRDVVYTAILIHSPQGDKLAGVAGSFFGENISQAPKAMKSFMKIDDNTPIINGYTQKSYLELQQSLEGMVTHGYWCTRSVLVPLDNLTDEFFDLIISAHERTPKGGEGSIINIQQFAGAIHDHSNTSTAFPSRDAHYWFEFVGRASDESALPAVEKWATEEQAKLKKFGVSTYINGVDIFDPSTTLYRHNYGRLLELKKKIDPNNVFHHNSNINPNTKSL